MRTLHKENFKNKQQMFIRKSRQGQLQGFQRTGVQLKKFPRLSPIIHKGKMGYRLNKQNF